MAKKKVSNKKGLSAKQKAGIGVGLTAAAVAAAGAYFLYGSKNAPKNRKKVKSWSLKAKAEVLEALEKAEQITEDEFEALVEGVTKTYQKVQKLSKNEMKDFKKEMSENWSGLVKSGAAKIIAVENMAKKLKSKPAKKATKKAPQKKTAAKKASAKKAPAKKAKKTTKKK